MILSILLFFLLIWIIDWYFDLDFIDNFVSFEIFVDIYNYLVFIAFNLYLEFLDECIVIVVEVTDGLESWLIQLFVFLFLEE